MEHDLEITLALLTRTPAVLNALLRGLPEMWTEHNEGENTWNARDVVAHLIHGENQNWISRAKLILESGETRTFVPFDREGQVRYGRGKTLVQLLDEFTQARAAGLEDLRAMKLTREDLNRRGRHPSLGAVTLSELLAAWAAHDL
ncbi:MAG TPA: DinB family protein, partial [Terracidiphilus sp.]|nr:DinB family protein [Terracidiphilus sp.]